MSNAQRAEVKAISDYNIAQVRLSQAMGTVLDMRYIRKALPVDEETTAKGSDAVIEALLSKVEDWTY